MVKQPFSKSLIPEQWGLRHTIEGTLAVKNIVAGDVFSIIVINFVPVRKVEEYVVTVKVRIDKSGIHVHLMDFPAFLAADTEEGTSGGKVYDWRERF